MIEAGKGGDGRGQDPEIAATRSGIPTQKDVARFAGVSPATVSRTLRGGENVRPDVQEKVLDAVRALRYLPNHSARTIRPGQHSGLIGVTVTDLSNPYYGTFALGVEQVAAERGRYVLLGSTVESATREAELIFNFISWQVEGLIVVPASEPSEHQWISRLGRIPLVIASREIEGTGFDVVVVDDLHMAERATMDLIAEGHSRIAFIGKAESVSTHRNRYQGFKQAMHHRRLAVDPGLVRTTVDAEVEGARRFATDLLQRPDPPSVILCANNRLAIGVLDAFGEAVSGSLEAASMPVVVCFDHLELANLLPLSVRTIPHDPQELGRAAANLLFNRLEDPDRPPQRVVLPI